MTKISETPAMAPAKNWKPKGRAIHRKTKGSDFYFFIFSQDKLTLLYRFRHDIFMKKKVKGKRERNKIS
jgi:hypothetical protein